MSVSVATGQAQVEGFFYENDSALALTIATAHATLGRIDTVVVRLDRTANSATLVVVTGTAAASPVAPTLSATDSLYELPLANVQVDPAVGVITAGKVTDRRVLVKNLTEAAASAAYRALAFRGAAVFTSGAAQSIPDSTYTAIAFASETADTSGFHDNVTNNSRLTIPAGMGGWYAITAQVAWTANATGARVLSIRKNGSSYLSDSGSTAPAGADPTKTTVMVRALLAAGDYVEIMGRQSSGGALTVSGPNINHAEIEFLGA